MKTLEFPKGVLIFAIFIGSRLDEVGKGQVNFRSEVGSKVRSKLGSDLESEAKSNVEVQCLKLKVKGQRLQINVRRSQIQGRR